MGSNCRECAAAFDDLLARLDGRANGAVVAQRFYTPLVGGSNPSSPTIFFFNESIQ
jgi:hypothetical protein